MDERDQIRERVNIVDLIAESVPLKKMGRNFKGLCPFHNERTPSFVVSPERQIWHCFGCQKGGDCFSFLMELDRLEFPEALKILAQRAGVTLRSRPETGTSKLKDRLLELHHLASEFYHYILIKHPLGERARRYIKERGVNDKLLNTFGLGFAPASWENLTRFLRKKGFTERELDSSGLSLRGRNGLYDRFRGRLMFPLKNHRGETIAFSGRLLDPEAKEAKYVNSPETPLYIKGATLYGLEVTKDAIRKEGSAIVVEGEFDVISSFAAGVANVVAIKGSALTDMQVALLKRFTERLILALDTDVAGDAAARRGIEIADRAGLDVRVVAIPSGKDPDEAARENASQWREAVKIAVPFYDFVLSSAVRRHGVIEAYGKKKISDEVLPILAKITNPVILGHYVKKLATQLELSEERVYDALKKVQRVPAGAAVSKAPEAKKSPPDQATSLEEHLLSLLLQSDEMVTILEQVKSHLALEEFYDMRVRRILLSLSENLAKNPKLQISEFIKLLPAELAPLCDRLLLVDVPLFPDPEELLQEVAKTLLFIKRLRLRRKIRELMTKLSTLEVSGEEEQVKKINTELKKATTALKLIS